MEGEGGEVLLDAGKPTRLEYSNASRASQGAAASLWTRLSDVTSQVDVFRTD